MPIGTKPTEIAKHMKSLHFLLLVCATMAAQPIMANPTTDNVTSAIENTEATAILSQEPASPPAPEPDSRQMEKDLQQLPWKQARSIIESVPKLKASVDAYGPLGWQFVEANYQHYRWKKNIDKLDATKKRDLAELIRKAQNTQH